MEMSETRLSREELYERVWRTPMRRLAVEFGVSDVGLAKLCRTHDVPTPPRGYWVKSEAQRQALRPKLRGADGTVEEIVIRASIALAAGGQSARQPIAVDVPQELVNPRPIVAITARTLPTSKRGDDGLASPRAKRALPIRIGPQSVDRSARILNSLLDCLDQRGHLFAVKATTHSRQMTATVDGEEIAFAFGEEVARETRELTPTEKRLQERQPWIYREPLYNCSPSGRLFLRIDHYCSGLRKRWADGKRQRLEACLGSFVAHLEMVAAQTKADRLERAKAEQRRRVWETERAEKLRQIHEEEERLKTLQAQVEAWHKSERIRRFASAVRAALDDGQLKRTEALEHWLGWVCDQADRLDPIVESPPSILDEKSRYQSYYYTPAPAEDDASSE